MVEPPTTGEHAPEDLLLEYAALREEIRHNDAIGVQILGASLVLIGALTALVGSETIATNEAKGWLVLLINLVAVIGLDQRTGLARHTFRAAAYLQVFVEPGLPGARYESRLAALRAASPQPTWRMQSGSGRRAYYAIMAISLGWAARLLAPGWNPLDWGWSEVAEAAVIGLLAWASLLTVWQSLRGTRDFYPQDDTPSKLVAQWTRVAELERATTIERVRG